MCPDQHSSISQSLESNKQQQFALTQISMQGLLSCEVSWRQQRLPQDYMTARTGHVVGFFCLFCFNLRTQGASGLQGCLARKFVQ